MFKNRNFVLGSLATLLGSAALFAASSAPNVAAESSINSPAAQASDAPIDMKKVSEAFGHFIGKHLKSPNVAFDLDSVIKGMREGVQGLPSPLTEKEYEQAMLQIQKTSFEKNSKENLKAADDYVQKNSKSTGFVEVKPNKLYYKIVTPGTGPAVEEHGTPQIKYTGKFIDGTVFGSSESSGGPVTIPLDQTIPGFGLGIVGMKEGEKRELIVHPDLGYGTTGHLPPNSLLLFEIELVKAKSPEKSDTDFDDEDDDDEDDDDDSPLSLSDKKDRKAKTSKDHDDEDEDDDDYDRH